MNHHPVLLEEALAFLSVQPEGVYVDATVGGGGHAAAIATRLKGGRVIGIDCDPYALNQAETKLANYGECVVLKRANFRDLKAVLAEHDVSHIDGIIFDLGVSSFQLDRAERGFSFRFDGPLDMRMDPELNLTAADIVNQFSEEDLVRILREYGEEPRAKRIARAIGRARERQPIGSTRQLAELIETAIPATVRRRSRVHPATRTFQALRIALNHELENLREGLSQGFECLTIGGRLVVISFHSLEDRIVKQFLREKAQRCICPPDFPVCRCSKVQELKAYGPVTPSAQELQKNPRSRSAKLRAAVKLV